MKKYNFTQPEMLAHTTRAIFIGLAIGFVIGIIIGKLAVIC